MMRPLTMMMTKIFIHGLESSNQGTKSLFFRKKYPDSRSRIYLLDGIALFVILLGFFAPDTYLALMEEDYIAEWTTFYAFLTAALIIAVRLLRSLCRGLSFRLHIHGTGRERIRRKVRQGL